LVLAVLTDPAEAGDSVIETRKRSDFAGAEIHVRATVAGIQARSEREFYETLTEKLQRSFRGVEASLLLFHPK